MAYEFCKKCNWEISQCRCKTEQAGSNSALSDGLSCDHVFGSWMFGEVVCNHCHEPAPLTGSLRVEDYYTPWWKRMWRKIIAR